MEGPNKLPTHLGDQPAHPTTESAVESAAAPELVGLVTHEDVDRARDRWEVAQARRKGRSKTVWRSSPALAIGRPRRSSFSR